MNAAETIFEVTAAADGSSARCGLLKTAAGTVETPVFMPVGTRATVKGITPHHIAETGTKVVLANTYHLMLRPGADIVHSIGGLHKMMAWDGPILTDSGGYQVFSLSELNMIGDDGVEFASHIDGAKIRLDPKSVMETQNKLGADIVMCFDQCPPLPSSRQKVEHAVSRTIRWARQCKEIHARDDQLLFAIVQGGVDKNLRTDCARKLVDIGFPGYAIGGLSVGETHEEMIETTRATTENLPFDSPRYLMGVGMPRDIIAAVSAGVDMFDCVLPSRNGRNAYAFTADGAMRMRNNCWTDDTRPIEPGCGCYACRTFSRAAIRHFFNVGEMMGPILVTIHNINFYQRLMDEIRTRIKNGSFARWANEMEYKTQNTKQTNNGTNG